MKEKSNKRVVVIGGGTGVFTVLTGLKRYFKNLTAVVTMADDGGSSGVLREEFGILPPGDIRRALIALSSVDQSVLSRLFGYRFQEGSMFAGHSFGNLMLTALERITGSFERAVEEAGKILSVQGRALPVTLRPAYLVAQMEDGRVIRGESNLDVGKFSGWMAVKKVWLDPPVPVNPKAREAILGADIVTIGPGDLYTSLVPNIIVRGVKEALKRTKGKIIYFTNMTTKFNETAGFSASDFLRVIEHYLGKGVVDYVVVNNKRPPLERMKSYLEQKSEFVEPDIERFGDDPTPIMTDLLSPSGLVRHDPEKIAKVVTMLL